MTDTLDMSTASLISRDSTAANQLPEDGQSLGSSQITSTVSDSIQPSTSIPSLPSPPSPPSPRATLASMQASKVESLVHPAYTSPHETLVADSETKVDQVQDQEESDSKEPRDPLPLPKTPVQINAKLVLAYVKTALISLSQFIFKDNNLPLFINVIHHLSMARSLMTHPEQTVHRHVHLPPMQPGKPLSNHRPVIAAATLANDAFRAIGAMHLALGVLAGLALKERRINTERTALLILTMASAGQAWAQARGYWEAGSRYTLKALYELVSADTVVLLISSIALSKTVHKTGRLL